jgi:hypothetical protein
MDHAHDAERGVRLVERFEDVLREREERAGADFARALEQLARALERGFLAIADVRVFLSIVDEEEVVRDGVALQERGGRSARSLRCSW